MIFSKRNKRCADSRFIGAYLPAHLVESLTLLAMSEGKSKTQILQCFVEEGLKKHVSYVLSTNTSKLCERVAKKAIQLWDKDRQDQQKRYRNYNSFLKACEGELKDKKDLSPASVQRIMVELRKVRSLV